MTISYQWLLAYLPTPLPLEELTQILTSIGLEVEGTEPAGIAGPGLDGLIVGEVLTCDKHPDADKLKVTTVNIGAGDPLHIVCGAPNVAAGQKVVVATIGTLLYPVKGEPFKIKKSKIRGALSEGMLCAEDEIGIGESHAGIMVLPEDTIVGTPVKDLLSVPVADTLIHIGLTPNRADAMSHIGVARDVCAYLTHHTGRKHEVVMPDTSFDANNAGDAPVRVTIEALEACPRYAGMSLTNIQVGPSPDWMQERLKAVGVRPINNVVDVTNFVLHEFGQPLHAFDASAIAGNEIHVRFLPEGTAFLSLDDKERKLQANDLMICDAAKGMCIAGVFGGKYSGVKETTTSIFLESAHFNRLFIRRTSTHHGLRTDAATRFEKGADIDNVIPALHRAVHLLTTLCGAQVVGSVTDVYPSPVNKTVIQTSLSFIQKLSGKTYALDAVVSILEALEFQVAVSEADNLTITVPTGKTDVLQPADIVEEILRIDGLDNIAIPERLNISLLPQKGDERAAKEKLSSLLYGAGFQEIVTNSITNSKYYPDHPALVRMMNSLSSELDILRPSMLESGLEVIQYNSNRKQEDLKLFEWGKTYQTTSQGYDEQEQLACWIIGDVREGGWEEKTKPASLFYVKGMLQNMMLRAGIGRGVAEGTNEQGGITWVWNKQVIAEVREVSAERLRLFDVRKPVFFAIIHWKVWKKAAAGNKIRYSEVPKFPAVTRDLSLVLDEQVTYQQLATATDGLKLQSLCGYKLFDVFRNEKLGQQKKAYAMSYTFQLQDRTLTDTEIDGLMQRLMRTYSEQLGATIRD